MTKYWLNLYTWGTWKEFVKAGASTTGFRETTKQTVEKIQPGDLFICYMTGISRYFAVQRILSPVFRDETPIWNEEIFPYRFKVEILLQLQPEHSVPVLSLRDDLSIFQNMSSPHSWSGSFRRSPARISEGDGNIILAALEEAERHPIKREYDQRKLERKVNVYRTSSGDVSIPEDDEEPITKPTKPVTQSEIDETTHEEIQRLLLRLGSSMGLDLWVANNDRGRFKDVKLRKELPIQFDAATNRTIELIDVLWLQDNRIVAAFEIEHTTSVYSGLLRMADLITMQPNINIPLYIAAPDERYDKVKKEINRPVFSRALKQPLTKICYFIPYSVLKDKMRDAEAGGFLRYLRPDFLGEIAENMELDEI